MKKMQNYFASAVIILSFASCVKSSTTSNVTTGDWFRKSEMNGVGRTEAVSFTIDNIVYVGTGYDGTYRLTDFWAYDASTNSWSQKASFTGTARSSAVGFAIGSQGFVGTGYDGFNKLSDFYRYNQASNTWDSVAAFPGTARYDAVAFALSGKGYVATGYDGTYQKDFWEYNPTSGTLGSWTQKNSFGGDKRSGAVSFVYGTKAYIVTGTNNGQEVTDLWSYDASTDAWTQKRNINNSNSSQSYDDDYTDIIRDNAISFVIGDYGFITTGANGSLQNTTWRYNFATDLWDRRSPFQGTARQGAVGFAIGSYGYVTCGKSSTAYFDDLSLFDPTKTLDTNDYQ